LKVCVKYAVSAGSDPKPCRRLLDFEGLRQKNLLLPEQIRFGCAEGLRQKKLLLPEQIIANHAENLCGSKPLMIDHSENRMGCK
jgi:hypothetical protein